MTGFFSKQTSLVHVNTKPAIAWKDMSLNIANFEVWTAIRYVRAASTATVII